MIDFWRRHSAWIVGCLIALAAAVAAYVYERRQHGIEPSGSSLIGFWLGVLAAGIIVFELMLTWRKVVRGGRWGRTQTWMRAHIWLGILCAPLALLHTGFRFGGWFPTALLVVLLLVIASGIYGTYLQWRCRQMELDEVATETVFAEIPRVMGRYVELAEQHLKVVCEPADKDQDGAVFRALRVGLKHAPPGGVLTVAKPRPERPQEEWKSLGLTAEDPEPIPGSEPLRTFFDELVRGYLLYGEKSGSPLHARHAAIQLFNEIKTRVPPAAAPTADALQRLCNIRRQLDRQAQLHHRVHGWMLVHIPLAWALVPLLAVHVWTALRYW